MDKHRRVSKHDTSMEHCVTSSGETEWPGRYLTLDCIALIASPGQLLVIYQGPTNILHCLSLMLCAARPLHHFSS